MSRHEIPSRDPAHKVIVGWDPMLVTYYAQVIDRAIEAAGEDDEHDKFVLWVGAAPPAIRNIDALAVQLRPYAELTEAMRRTLYRDREEDP